MEIAKQYYDFYYMGPYEVKRDLLDKGKTYVPDIETRSASLKVVYAREYDTYSFVGYLMEKNNGATQPHLIVFKDNQSGFMLHTKIFAIEHMVLILQKRK